MSPSWAACVGGGREARVRGVCVGVSALSPLGEDRCCSRSRARHAVYRPRLGRLLSLRFQLVNLSSRGVDVVVS